jgi:hypothetical protein
MKFLLIFSGFKHRFQSIWQYVYIYIYIYIYILSNSCSLQVIEIGKIEFIVRKCSVRSIQPVKATATEIPPTVPSMNANLHVFI